MKSNPWLITGGLAGMLAVILGAFGAHGLEEAIPAWYGLQDLPVESTASGATEEMAASAEMEEARPAWYRLDELHREKLATWRTGVRYHFFHAVAILVVGILATIFAQRPKLLDLSAVLFLLGILGFSGSLYLYVLTKIKIFGMTAAGGGVLMVAGWVCFVGAACRLPQRSRSESA